MPDITLTITIPDDKLTEFRLGFLKADPLPAGSTEKDWLLRCIKRYLVRRYRKGKLLLSQETAEFQDIFVEA